MIRCVSCKANNELEIANCTYNKWLLSVSSIMNDNNVASLVVVGCCCSTSGGATRIISLHPYSFVHFLLPMGTVHLFITSNNKSNSRLFYYLIDLESWHIIIMVSFSLPTSLKLLLGLSNRIKIILRYLMKKRLILKIQKTKKLACLHRF